MRMTCGIPDRLITEILNGLAEKMRIGGKVVLDLCAGFQSIRQSVLRAGASYVGVDIAGRRAVKATPARRAAVVLVAGRHVLSVKHKLQDGNHAVTLPGGKWEQRDSSCTARRDDTVASTLAWLLRTATMTPPPVGSACMRAPR